jgi:NitT/TauT family transport system substrate-binding protein
MQQNGGVRMLRRGAIAGAALCLAAPFIPRVARAANRVKLAVGTNTLAVDTATYASLPFALGYFEQEGLQVEMVPLAGAGLVGQLLIGGGAFMGTPGTSAGLFIPDSQGADLVSVYNVVTKSFQLPAVPVASPIVRMADFRGKRIGVQSLASGTVPIVKALLRDAGVDAERDTQFVPVGLGAQAAAALFYSKIVDALALWDGPYASITNINPAQYALRIVSSPLAEQIGFQVAMVVQRKSLSTQRDAAVGIARSVAKSTVFAMANLEAAVRLHFQVYPEQRGSDLSEAEAVRQGMAVLGARLANVGIRDSWTQKLWGWHEATDVEGYYRLLRGMGELQYDIPNVSRVYTNELIADINRFDVAHVKTEALSK